MAKEHLHKHVRAPKRRRVRVKGGESSYIVVRWKVPNQNRWAQRQFPDTPIGESQGRDFAVRKSQEITDADREGGYVDREHVTLGSLIDVVEDGRRGAKVKRLRGSAARGTINSLARFARYLGGYRRGDHESAGRKADAEARGKRVRLVDILPANVVEFQDALEAEGLSTNSVSKHIRTIKAAFTSAAAKGLARSGWNPAKHESVIVSVDPPEQVRVLTADEDAALYAAARKMDDPIWWECLLNVMLFAGLRAGEAENLTWDDVDFARRVIKVQPKNDTPTTLAWKPKTRAGRRDVPMMPDGELTLLRNYRDTLPDGFAYVFLPPARFEALRAARDEGIAWETGEHSGLSHDDAKALRAKGRKQRESVEDREITMPTQRKQFARVLVSNANDILREQFDDDGATLEVDGRAAVSLHDLRRTAISRWLAAGMSITKATKYAGHSTSTVTYTYYTAIIDDRSDADRSIAESLSRHSEPRLVDESGAISGAIDAA